VLTRQSFLWLLPLAAWFLLRSPAPAARRLAGAALLALALAPLGMLGIRIVFVHLFVLAIVTWALRKGISESARWTAAAGNGVAVRAKLRNLFRGKNLHALIWTAAIYLSWNLAAGTNGIFTPYMVKTLHAGGQAASVALSGAGFLIGIIATVVLFMRYSDRGFGVRKAMWLTGGVLQVAAFGLFLLLPFTVPVIIANIALFGVGQALAGEAFYKVFSQELFPTLLRGTAQGLTFGAARLALGIWSIFVPALAAHGIGPVAAVLTGFLFISAAVGFLFMPDTAGKSLEEIETERATA
jgi:inositol transporter-like SP family MFS transporter